MTTAPIRTPAEANAKPATRREKIMVVARRAHACAEFVATCLVVASLSPLIVSLHAAKFIHDRFFKCEGEVPSLASPACSKTPSAVSEEFLQKA